MLDELNMGTEQHQVEPTEQPTQTQQQSQDSQKEANMRILRERAENAERRSIELERMIQANMNQNKPSEKIEIADEDDMDLDDSALIEGKQFKKYVKSLKQELKNTKKQFEEYNQRSSLEQAELRLKSQFNDFDSIVSRENLEKLATQKPSLYRSIMANQDIFDRGYTAYEMIKGSGVLNNEYAHIDKKIEDNRSKPKSAGNAGPQTGDTPLAQIGDYDRRELSEERKLQLRQQVAKAKMYR